MIEPKPRIVRCKLCRHYMWSEYYGEWYCSLNQHETTEHDGCTFGEEQR